MLPNINFEYFIGAIISKKKAKNAVTRSNEVVTLNFNCHMRAVEGGFCVDRNDVNSSFWGNDAMLCSTNHA